MNRQEFVLAVLAAGDAVEHNSTQVQKLFFLLDRKVPEQVGGPWFAFQPYDYGPYDRAVYEELRALTSRGLVSITKGKGASRAYHLIPEGNAEGQVQLKKLPPATADYIRRLSAWVRRLSFEQLVSAIYRAFPDMSAKGVFRGA
ncbi:MAG TPA: hypothetical protein VKA46_42160 [Gemmataceae bacterium]|nr:hypothetical protein [Gemmataceae bacterium]